MSSSPVLAATQRTNPKRTNPKRTAALLTAGLIIALAFGACTTGDDEDPPGDAGAAVAGAAGDAEHTYARYVALGDSFAALGPISAPTTGPAGCERSTRGYPALLAQRPDVGELVDVSCSGAETAHMTTRQFPGAPPQFDALTAGTDLVTLSVGGNDIRFGAIVECVEQTTPTATGAPCRDRLENPVTDALDELRARLDEVYAGIRQRSPDARIVTTEYLPLVPASGGCEYVDGVSPGDIVWVRRVTERINSILGDAADRAGAELAVPDDAASRHACAPPAVRYTDFTGVETGSHAMHLTAAGHRAMADAVGAVL